MHDPFHGSGMSRYLRRRSHVEGARGLHVSTLRVYLHSARLLCLSSLIFNNSTAELYLVPSYNTQSAIMDLDNNVESRLNEIATLS